MDTRTPEKVPMISKKSESDASYSVIIKSALTDEFLAIVQF